MENIVLFHFYKLKDQYRIDVITSNKNKLEYTYNREELWKQLNALRKLADSDDECFHALIPWINVTENDLESNKRILVAYNTKLNSIQGWCNFIYEIIKIKHSTIPINALYVSEINTRTIPKIKGLGSYMLEFIINQCIKNVTFTNIDVDLTTSIDVDVIYLFSLKKSQEFYRKTRLFEEYKIFNGNSVFYRIITSLDNDDFNKFDQLKCKWIQEFNNYDRYYDEKELRMEYEFDKDSIKNISTDKCNNVKEPIRLYSQTQLY